MATLEDLFDAWDKENGGRDEDRARAIAKEYAQENPAQFAVFDGKTIDELVQMVDGCREAKALFEKAGLADEALKVDVQKLLVDVFLLAYVPKQYVGGPALNATVRIANG